MAILKSTKGKKAAPKVAPKTEEPKAAPKAAPATPPRTAVFHKRPTELDVLRKEVKRLEQRLDRLIKMLPRSIIPPHVKKKL